jgi:hypothetical protein
VKYLRSLSIALSILIIAGLLASTLIVNAFYETFSLTINPPSKDATVVRFVKVNRGDRIIGDFSLFNIPGWSAGGGSTYPHSVTLYEPNGGVVFKFDNTNSASFDNTAYNSGDYKFEFYVEIGQWAPSLTLDYAQGTLNYEVVKSASTQTKENNALFYGLIIIITILLVGGFGIYFDNRRRRKKLYDTPLEQSAE